MEKERHFWVENVPEIYVCYHDEEWGGEVHDDHKLFEILLLESLQAGLPQLTILKKRKAFQEAFGVSGVVKVTSHIKEKQKEFMQDPGTIYNRLKIRVTVKNTVIFQQIQREYGSFSVYLWGFTKGGVVYRTQEELPTHAVLSNEVSAGLCKCGTRPIGSAIVYSYLQAVGIVNDHEPGYFLHTSSKTCG